MLLISRRPNQSMLASVANLPRLPGKTVVLVDVSGSMDRPSWAAGRT